MKNRKKPARDQTPAPSKSRARYDLYSRAYLFGASVVPLNSDSAEWVIRDPSFQMDEVG